MVEKPRTKLEDYITFKSKMDDLDVDVCSGAIPSGDFRRARCSLRAEYADKIFPEDEYLFGSVEEYRSFLIGILKDVGVVDDMVSHEVAHANAALDRGFDFEFGAHLCLNGDKSGCCPFLNVKGDVSLEDLTAIVSAPEKLSDSDLVLSRRASC